MDPVLPSICGMLEKSCLLLFNAVICIVSSVLRFLVKDSVCVPVAFGIKIPKKKSRHPHLIHCC